jgi:hypothetical protein
VGFLLGIENEINTNEKRWSITSEISVSIPHVKAVQK